MRYPAEVSEKPSTAGFMGPCLPEEYGGVDANFLPYVLVFEEISRADDGAGVALTHPKAARCPS